MSGGGKTTVAEALRRGTARLAAVGIEGAAGDARRLMAHALGLAPERLLPAGRDPLGDAAAAAWEAALAARLLRRPVAQIVGARLFWGRSFAVTRDTLDPRPETETLVAEALAAPFGRVLDLGTGTGCILVSLLAERPDAAGVGVDISPAALAVARANAGRHGVAQRSVFLEGDWFGPVAGAFDLIVANPPYLDADEIAGLAPEVRDWEPSLALSPGPDGLAAVRTIASGAARFLRPGGRILVEIGWRQGPAAARLFDAAGLAGVRVIRDLDGRDRAVCAERR